MSPNNDSKTAAGGGSTSNTKPKNKNKKDFTGTGFFNQNIKGPGVLDGLGSLKPLLNSFELPIDQVVPNPNQIRTDLDGPALEELIEDIRVRGILEPILVRLLADDPHHYEIVAGQRRYMAARAAGLVEVPVIIKEMDDQEARLVMLIENIQREELSPNDEKAFYLTLQNEYNYSVQQIADMIHKSRAYIYARLKDQLKGQQPVLSNQLQSENARKFNSEEGNNVSESDTLNNVSQADTAVSSLNNRQAGSGLRSFNPLVFHKLSVSLGKTLRLFDDDETPPSDETLGEISQSVSEVEETLNQLKARLNEASRGRSSEGWEVKTDGA